MAKVLVLYYSMYGHIETMAQAVAEGARSVSGAEVTVKRVPETMPAEAFTAYSQELSVNPQSCIGCGCPACPSCSCVRCG